jgi:hypothetical protein
LCRGGGEENSWCWMLHAAQVATRSQYSRNMVATWGRREEARWCLYVARNMLTTWLATWSLDFFYVIKVYFECCEDSFPRCEHIFGCCEAFDGNVED